MVIYHLHVKVIGRESSSSAVASAAYRSASQLSDDRFERSHDFSSKRGVVHSEIMLPGDAPEAWRDRERLWNELAKPIALGGAFVPPGPRFSRNRELFEQKQVDYWQKVTNYHYGLRTYGTFVYFSDSK
ncbi:MAG TPA: MobA/MobL family protein [Candidatus Binataceae bacterium]